MRESMWGRLKMQLARAKLNNFSHTLKLAFFEARSEIDDTTTWLYGDKLSA